MSDDLDMVLAEHSLPIVDGVRMMVPRNYPPVVCEPCLRGGGPRDCVRPCVKQGRSA